MTRGYDLALDDSPWAFGEHQGIRGRIIPRPGRRGGSGGGSRRPEVDNRTLSRPILRIDHNSVLCTRGYD